MFADWLLIYNSSICMFIYLFFLCLSDYRSIYQPIYLSVNPSDLSQSIWLSIYQSIYLLSLLYYERLHCFFPQHLSCTSITLFLSVLLLSVIHSLLFLFKSSPLCILPQSLIRLLSLSALYEVDREQDEHLNNRAVAKSL